MRFQPLPGDQYTRYKEALSGLTSDNAHLVTQKLIELGLTPSAGIGLPGDIPMKEADDPDLKRLRSTAVGLLGEERGEQFAAMLAQL